MDNLRSLGVRYVVVHTDQLTNETQQAALADVAETTSSVQLAQRFGPDLVFALDPFPRQPTLEQVADVDVPTELGRGLDASATLTIDNDLDRPLAADGSLPFVANVSWDGGAGTDVGLTRLPTFLPAHSHLAFPIPLGTTPAGDRANLRVRVSGPVQLDVQRTVALQDFLLSNQPTGLADQVEQVSLPPVVRANTTTEIDVRARNTGRTIWLGPSETQKGRVGMSVRSWRTADGQSATTPDGSVLRTAAFHLVHNVNPGQEAQLKIVSLTPARPGPYQLVLDMISENVGWFTDLAGGDPTVVPVTVES